MWCRQAGDYHFGDIELSEMLLESCADERTVHVFLQNGLTWDWVEAFFKPEAVVGRVENGPWMMRPVSDVDDLPTEAPPFIQNKQHLFLRMGVIP